HLRGTGDLPDAGGGRRARGGSGHAGALPALGRRYRLAWSARHAEEADGRRRRRSGCALPVCAAGRPGVLRAARVEAGAGAVDPEGRVKARTAAAGPADVRDAAGIARTAGFTALVGG